MLGKVLLIVPRAGIPSTKERFFYGYFMPKSKQQTNQTRQDFLLTFFDTPHHYSHIELNGFILERSFNAVTGRWQVAIYTHESWDYKQKYLERHKTGKQDSFPDTVT